MIEELGEGRGGGREEKVVRRSRRRTDDDDDEYFRTSFPVSYTHLDVYKRQKLNSTNVNEAELDDVYVNSHVKYLQLHAKNREKRILPLSHFPSLSFSLSFSLSLSPSLCTHCLLYTSRCV